MLDQETGAPAAPTTLDTLKQAVTDAETALGAAKASEKAALEVFAQAQAGAHQALQAVEAAREALAAAVLAAAESTEV